MKNKITIFCIIAFSFMQTLFAFSPELHFATGHGDGITCTAWSRDGNYIATASDDKTICIWDAKTGKELRTLIGHTDEINHISWSYDSKQIASISRRAEQIYVWDALTGEKIQEEDAWGECIAWSPVDSKLAATDRSVFVYENNDWIFFLHPSGVCYSVAWSPDAKFIVTTGYDHTVRVWNVQQKKEVAVCTGHSDVVYYACFSPDGKYVASASRDGTARVWDAFSGKELFQLHGHKRSIERITWSPDGKYIATYGDAIDSTLRVFNAKNGNLLYEQKDSGTGLSVESWSPDGTCLAIGGRKTDSFINIKKASDGSILMTLGNHLEEVMSVALNKDDSLLSVSAEENLIRIFNSHSNESVLSFTTSKYSTSAWSPDGKNIASASDDYDLQFNDIYGNNKRGSRCYGDRLTWSCDGKYIASGESNEIRIYDAKSGKNIKILNQSADIVHFSPNSKYLASVSDRGKKIFIWKVSNWRVYKTLDVQSDHSIVTLVWSPHGNYLATGGIGDLIIWNTKSWKEEFNACDDFNDDDDDDFYDDDDEFSDDDNNDIDSCYSLAWMPNEKYLVVGDMDGVITIWDWHARKTIQTLHGHTGWVTSLALTSDGKTLYSGSRDGTVRTWNLGSGKLLSTTLIASNDEWLTFTPEGYFTGTNWAIKNLVHLVNGMEVTGLDQLAESLYRPDLVAAKLRGENISAQEGTTSLTEIVSTGEAPLVQFVNPPASSSSRDITVNFSVQDAGGGVGSVYLKLNDKVIQLADGSRKFEFVGGETTALTQSNENRMNFSHLLTLQNGENTLEAYATNAAGKIESRHAVAKISWNGSTAKPNLYVLSVGVNKYRDRSLWLNYAVPDAVSIAESFKSAKGNLYQSVNAETLFDGDVTKESLTAKFKELSPKVCADDVFVLFISGHGTISNKTGDYYFIPSNFRYTDSDALFAQGISKNDILGYMSGIQAQKSLIMLDTCNSGAFTNDSAARGFAEKSALERLVHATGQAVLTAASEEQSAMEGYEGHGIFTYVLLDALSGKADRNKDGYITLNELASYIEELVPELSYQKWGYEQVPMKDLRKQDFPLVGN
ncbi:MAG: caspase family protein [Treponema sp.]|nr:caspase family protein [Treponema sp.]